ncbi:BlaI/MecI/CopY family transcriptional regulator [Cyclobacterium xiamenense]|jgi:predicted transcriptional regulator|uniref:BlaI/MecI/CopY family transcriptional regulator n=1 Tax=Cyclobacterium xiamenense TaxID=1297121 RepID=UPI0035D09BB1
MQERPTSAELEVLAILWELETASVRQVHERLAKEKDTGYTTTLKTMQNMHAKGLLARDDKKRTHVYQALVSQQDTQKSLVKRFIRKAFGGSANKLVMQALGQSQPSREEIEEIRAFLDQIEKKKS